MKREMDLTFLPKRLVSFCNNVIETYHRQRGYSELAAHLWDKDTMAFIVIHEDLFTLLKAGIALSRLRNLCLLASGGLLILAIFINWWIAFGILPVLIIASHLTKRSNSFYVLISALFLALQIFDNNYGDLAKHLPSVGRTARAKVDQYFPDGRTRFLDFYLPTRDGIEPEAFDLLRSSVLQEA